MNLVLVWCLFGVYCCRNRQINTKPCKRRMVKNLLISAIFGNCERPQNPGIQIRNQQVSGSSPLTSSTQTRMNTRFVRVFVLPRYPSAPVLVVIWSLLLQKHTKRYPQIRERAAGCFPCFPLVFFSYGYTMIGRTGKLGSIDADCGYCQGYRQSSPCM